MLKNLSRRKGGCHENLFTLKRALPHTAYSCKNILINHHLVLANTVRVFLEHSVRLTIRVKNCLMVPRKRTVEDFENCFHVADVKRKWSIFSLVMRCEDAETFSAHYDDYDHSIYAVETMVHKIEQYIRTLALNVDSVDTFCTS